MAHLGPAGMPMMWYPPGSTWDMSMGGSTMSLNHPSMWNYPLGYPPAQILPPHYPGAFSRPHSPARSLKSGRRSRAPSPSPSLKSRKSLASSRSRSRRSPGSPSDASSEDSDDSDIDDRLSRGSRSTRRGSVTRNPRQRSYHEDDGSRSLLSRNRRERLLSEERVLSNEDHRSESHPSKRYPTSSRNYQEEFPPSSVNSRRRYSQDERSVAKPTARLERVQNGGYRDRRKRSSDDESSDRRSTTLPGRSRVTSSSDDHFERAEIALRQKEAEARVKRGSSLRRDSVLDDSAGVGRRDSRRSSIDSDAQISRRASSRDTISRRGEEAGERVAGEGKLEEDERTGRSSQRVQRTRDPSRDRENTPKKRESSLRRDGSLDEMERSSGKRSSGRSSLESDSQSSKKTLPRDTAARRSRESEDRDVSQVSRRSQETESSKDGSRDTPRRRKIEAGPIEASLDDRGSSAEKVSAEKPVEKARTMEIPKEEWPCEHCTFINNVNDRVCVVCCKTRSSALPPENPEDAESVPDAPSIPEEAQPSKSGSVASSNVSEPSPDLEKKTSLLKVSNSEESGDSGSARNKGRTRRKISFSFGTKSFK